MFDRPWLLALALATAPACFPFGEYQASTGGGGEGGEGAAAAAPAGGSGGEGGDGGAAPLEPRALQVGNALLDELIDSAVDADGNVAIALRFRGELSVGSVTIGQRGGGPSIALAYYDRTLTPQWGRVLMNQAVVVEGTDEYAGTASIAFDAEGNLVVGGTYVADLLLDTRYTVEGFANAFLGKLTPRGQFTYSRVFADPNSQVATQVAVQKGSGHAYLSGFANVSISFDAGPGNCPSLEMSSGFDLFVAEFDTAGQCVRQTKFGDGEMGPGTLSVEPGNGGNVLITGTYGNPVTFGDSALTPQPGGTGKNVFFARLGSDLSPVFALDVGPVVTENGNLVAAHPAGADTFLSGAMVPPLTIGGIDTGFGQNDMYVARLGAEGGLLFENNFGGPGMDGGRIAVDPNGNARLYGNFVGTAPIGENTVTSLGGSRDILIVALGGNLEPSTYEHIVGSGEDVIGGIGFARGEEILIGNFSEAIELGTGTLETSGPADRDIFIYARPLPGSD